ncbi:DUF1540 domain-containing protein [Desulfofalx alkaliphila]|uniref:DUF1540 domain-containing protein n=1 Tax=Desulfofalx alkaliphila TaxID=105483 RepID=UPI0004E1675A|nr:DUF1540 domain-containing protein [Desulfofalx alkaliphila]
MAQQHIHCSVNNCHYWQNGNKCMANEIVVVSDDFGAQQPDYVDASLAQQIAPTPAENCMQTCCKTFVHKNSSQIKADKVYRTQ